MKICLLLLEFLLVMHLPADHVECDTGLNESVRSDRMAALFTGPIAISTLAVDTRDGKIGDQYTDSFRELRVCPVIEVNTHRIC